MDLVTPKAPEEIFPLEVWDLILDQLISSSDLINCNQVCKAWRKLLELKQTTFFMPKVFPILYKYLETVEDDEDENKEEKEETITTILKMRLVSHGWKEAVDSYLQNNHPVNEFSFEDLTLEDIGNDELVPYSPYQFGVGGDVTSGSIAKLESFLGKGFSPDINPFITREVCYCGNVDNELDQRRLNTAFKNMLEAFGPHIWTFELMSRTHTNRARFYKFVGSFLRLMPNLRSLQLRYFGRFSNGRRQTKSEKEELDMLLKNEPLPRLEHLTTLEMMYVPYPLSVGLLATNGHLQNLSFHIGDFNDALLPDYIANLHIPNLKLLRFPWCQKDLCCFKVGWPIKELILDVNIGKLSNVFQAVSSTFSNTLEHFALDYNDMIENNEKLQQTRLELPKLKKFRLEIIPFELKTIDFLQGCTALQEIQLAFKVPEDYEEYDDDSLNSSSTGEDEEDNAVIEFKHCITSMNRSNIWRILKNLQSIKLKLNGIEDCSGYIDDVTIDPYKIRRFTRHQFEKYCKAK